MKRLLIISVLLIFACWICATCLHGAVPTFESFSTNQFQTNSLRVFYNAVHTNDAGIVYPALDNTLTLVTNENVYGTFSLPSKVTLLTLGTNYLDMSTNTTWLLNSPTNDASQVIISLSAGAYQGQLALITSQNGANAFTLPHLSEQWDVPGAVVWLSGIDWIGTTNRGILMQYTAPDWVALWRFDPSGGGGGSVIGGGTTPFLPYWINPTTLGDSPMKRIDANTLGFGIATTNVVEIEMTNAISTSPFRLFLDTNGVGHVTAGNLDLRSTAGSARILSAASIYSFSGDILTPGVSNTFLLGTQLFPWKEVHVGTNSIYLGTNAYSDDGSSFLRNGIPVGGGSTLWASAGGVLTPSPAVDVVSITSQLADNATNSALVVDTAAPWTSGFLAEFKNQGSNTTTIASHGGIGIGKNLDFDWGPLNQFTKLVLLTDSSLGDPDFQSAYMVSMQDSTFANYGQIVMHTETNKTYQTWQVDYPLERQINVYVDDTGGSFELQYGATKLWSMSPDVPSTGSAVAYTFDTSNLLQSGDLVGAFKNKGTNVLSINSGGGILSGLGETTISTDYAFRSVHSQALGESSLNRLYIEDKVNNAGTNFAAVDITMNAPNSSTDTAANFLMDAGKGTKAAEFEVALNSNLTDSTGSFIRMKEEGSVVLFFNNQGIKTTAPPADTAQAWKFGSEAVLSTVTNLIVSVNGVKYSIVATPR